MIKAELMTKRNLKSTMREYLFEYKVQGVSAGETLEIEIDLLKEDDPVLKGTYPIRPFMEGRFLNFDVLMETPINFDCYMYSSKDFLYKDTILEYIDILPSERLADDTLNRYYTNRDEYTDHRVYMKIVNKGATGSGEITIRFICVDLTQVGRLG